jgi:hypothetical protein
VVKVSYISVRSLCAVVWGMRRLRVCGTGGNVAGSNPHEVTQLFFSSCPNDSSHIIVLGLTQPQIIARKYLWDEERGRRLRLTVSPPHVIPLFGQCGNLNISQPYSSQRSVTGIPLLFTF